MQDNTFSFLGTAFVCNSKSYLATCSHNINLSTAKNLHIVSIDVPLNEFTPLTHNRVNVSPVKVIQFDTNSDICLLKAEPSSTFNTPEKFLLETESINVGRRCLYIGYPFGDRGFHKVKVSSAMVSSKIINEQGVKQYLLDTMVHEGTSGDLETGYIFAIILVLTVLKLHKTDGDHLRKKV